MKSACLFLLVLMTMWDAAHAAEGGQRPEVVYAVGWTVEVSHAPLGIHPTSVFARSNTRIAQLLEETAADAKPYCFIAPFETGYRVVLLTSRPLDAKEQDAFWTLIQAEIAKAVEHDRKSTRSKKG